MQRCGFRPRIEFDDGLARVIDVRARDLEVERVERDGVGRLLHVDVDGGATGERECAGVGRHADLVVHRHHTPRQPSRERLIRRSQNRPGADEQGEQSDSDSHLRRVNGRPRRRNPVSGSPVAVHVDAWYIGTYIPQYQETTWPLATGSWSPACRPVCGWKVRIVKVLKALAEYKNMGLGDLLEGIVLHAFDGKTPFSPETLRKIRELKKVYDLDLDATASHRLEEKP